MTQVRLVLKNKLNWALFVCWDWFYLLKELPSRSLFVFYFNWPYLNSPLSTFPALKYGLPQTLVHSLLQFSSQTAIPLLFPNKLIFCTIWSWSQFTSLFRSTLWYVRQGPERISEGSGPGGHSDATPTLSELSLTAFSLPWSWYVHAFLSPRTKLSFGTLQALLGVYFKVVPFWLRPSSPCENSLDISVGFCEQTVSTEAGCEAIGPFLWTRVCLLKAG